jgi:hypothetical protein
MLAAGIVKSKSGPGVLSVVRHALPPFCGGELPNLHTQLTGDSLACRVCVCVVWFVTMVVASGCCCSF